MAKKRMLQDRGALPEEDGNKLRDNKARHDKNFLSSWLRQNVEGVQAEMKRLKEEGKQEEKSGKRERGGEQGKGGNQKKVLEVGIQ